MEIFKLVDTEYYGEVEQYRGDFAKVNVRDPKSLRAWFDAHPYLSIHDVVLIAQVSRKTVTAWRRAAGFKPGLGGIPPRKPWVPKLFTTPVPANWRTFAWLDDQYRQHSIREIAQMVGRSYFFTRRVMLRVGVQLRSTKEGIKSRHPCCCRAWLEEYYVNRGLSQGECAKLAGICTYQMETWLHRFGIRIRTITEQAAAKSYRRILSCHKSG